MLDPKSLRYTKEHEWVAENGRIGITDFAQGELGDIVFVELPGIGRQIKAGESFGVVESVKSVSDLYAPVSGKVVAINEELLDHPEKINTDAFGDGWLIEVSLDNPADRDALLDEAAYKAFTQGGS